MTCTHPVLYTNAQGQQYCHLCGVILSDKATDDKFPGQEEKPKETAKKAVKRKTKAEA